MESCTGAVKTLFRYVLPFLYPDTRKAGLIALASLPMECTNEAKTVTLQCQESKTKTHKTCSIQCLPQGGIRVCVQGISTQRQNKEDVQDMLKCLSQVENTASVEDISTQRQKMIRITLTRATESSHHAIALLAGNTTFQKRNRSEYRRV